MAEEAVRILEAISLKLRTDKVFVIKSVFLIAMMLWWHHRGLFHFLPIKLPIAHGINQLLGTIAGLIIGIIILFLTKRVFGW